MAIPLQQRTVAILMVVSEVFQQDIDEFLLASPCLLDVFWMKLLDRCPSMGCLLLSLIALFSKAQRRPEWMKA
jgi:hypothetical protein